MSEEIPPRRAEDSILRVWGPVVVPLLAAGALWGALQSDLSQIKITQKTLVADVRDLREDRAVTTVTVTSIREQLQASKISSETIGRLSEVMGGVEARVERIEDLFREQVWPRLRAQDERITLLAKHIEALEENDGASKD